MAHRNNAPADTPQPAHATAAAPDRFTGEERAATKERARELRAVPGGVVHPLPADLRSALTASAAARSAWTGITPLARNEFICWVEDARQQPTRQRRIRRTLEELAAGQRRPCCWPGCKHRQRTGRPADEIG